MKVLKEALIMGLAQKSQTEKCFLNRNFENLQTQLNATLRTVSRSEQIQIKLKGMLYWNQMKTIAN